MIFFNIGCFVRWTKLSFSHPDFIGEIFNLEEMEKLRIWKELAIKMLQLTAITWLFCLHAVNPSQKKEISVSAYGTHKDDLIRFGTSFFQKISKIPAKESRVEEGTFQGNSHFA